MSLEWNAGKNHNIKTGNKTFEFVDNLQIKIAFMNQLISNGTQEIHATIQFRIFLSPSLVSQNVKTKIDRTMFCLLFYMSVKRGLSH
jgi:hypothetical protein